MPDWQGELESLLASLNVSLEGSSPGVPLGNPLDGSHAPRVARSAETEPAEAREMRIPSEHTEEPAEALLDVVPVDGEEISAVRSEIEATLREVLALVQAGHMSRALRDDIVFVLEALTRPRPAQRPHVKKPAGPDDSSTEWNLASAAAVLRFCRIVLRLTNSLAREDDV